LLQNSFFYFFEKEAKHQYGMFSFFFFEKRLKSSFLSKKASG